MSARSLSEWLAHAERVHAVGIDLGLERVSRVAERMGFAAPARAPAPRSLIVAGTNGKGSTCVFAEALLRARGLEVGTTLSPHVHRFNERVRINGQPVDDATLCAAFAAVEVARGDVPLTYFEFSTLVALYAFRAAAVDVAVLEVGLGGRLDAFNLVSADVAVVTSIGLDHEEYLGRDLEQIGREKAGVMRPGQAVVLGADVTRSVVEQARSLGCRTRRAGIDFTVAQRARAWDYHGAAGQLTELPWGALAPDNCALALEAVRCLTELTASDVQAALASAALPGRCEPWLLDERLLIVDVAHNPAGAAFLRRLLEARYPGRRFVALLGTLADKPGGALADAMSGLVTQWVCVPTGGARGLAAAELQARLRAALPHATPIATVDDAASGLDRALSCSDPQDGILAFGSFSVVERVRDALLARPAHARMQGV